MMTDTIKFTIPGKTENYSFTTNLLPLPPLIKKKIRLEIAQKLPSDTIPLHACLVSNKTTSLLISGVSGSGKSTLAKNLKSLGYSVIANDFVAVWLVNHQLYASDINLEKNNFYKKPQRIDQLIFLKPNDHRDLFRLNLKQLQELYISTLTPLKTQYITPFIKSSVFKKIYDLHMCIGNRQSPKRWARCINNILSNKKPSKIGVIGMGTVGQDISNLLIGQPWLESLALYSPNQDKLRSIILDLKSAVPSLAISQETSAKSVFNKSDLVVLCFNQNDPNKIIDISNERYRKIINHSEICQKISRDIRSVKNFNGTVLVVSNPVDFLSYLIYHESGLLSNQVYGIGLGLDKKRLSTLTNKDLGVIGEHGDEIKIVKIKNDQMIQIDSHDLLSKLVSYSNRVRLFTPRTRFGPAHEILSVINGLRKKNSQIRVSTKRDGYFSGDILNLKDRIPMTKYTNSSTLEKTLALTKKQFEKYSKLLNPKP